MSASKYRERGSGSIFEVGGRGSGRWKAAVVYYDDAGVRHTKTANATSQKEAKARLVDLKAALAAPPPPPPVVVPPPALTVGVWAARWLRDTAQSVKGATLRQRRYFIQHFIVPSLGDIALVDLQPSDVAGMLRAMSAKGLSTGTTEGCRVCLAGLLGAAVDEELLGRNVAKAKAAKGPRIVTKPVETLTSAESEALLVYCGVEESMVADLVATALTSGLRQGELLALRWSDVDLDRGRVTVRAAISLDRDGSWKRQEPKTKSGLRTVPVPQATVTALLRQQARQDDWRRAADRAWTDSGLVFTDMAGGQLIGTTVATWTKRFLERAGAPAIRFHSLRHAAISYWINNGVGIATASKLAGHARVTTTIATYTQPDDVATQVAAQVWERGE